MKRLALVALLFSAAALARKPQRHPAKSKAVDPALFFASHPGLVRVYQGKQGKSRPAPSEEPAAGASCEVLSSRPRDPAGSGEMRESCTMIVGRKAKGHTELTYQLRKDGIWNTQVQTQGMAAPQAVDRLVLPGPLKIGAAWKEPRGSVELSRSVRSAGGSCKAAGRSFADCLVVSVVQKQGRNIVRRYTETYAEGVGLVEDAQWALIDVKGL